MPAESRLHIIPAAYGYNDARGKNLDRFISFFYGTVPNTRPQLGPKKPGYLSRHETAYACRHRSSCLVKHITALV